MNETKEPVAKEAEPSSPKGSSGASSSSDSSSSESSDLSDNEDEEEEVGKSEEPADKKANTSSSSRHSSASSSSDSSSSESSDSSSSSSDSSDDDIDEKDEPEMKTKYKLSDHQEGVACGRWGPIEKDELPREWKKPYEVISSAVGKHAVDEGFEGLATYPSLPEGSAPDAGDVIAFQELTLCEESFTPKLSEIKYARVVAKNDQAIHVISASSQQELEFLTKDSETIDQTGSLEEVSLESLANIHLLSGPSRTTLATAKQRECDKSQEASEAQSRRKHPRSVECGVTSEAERKKAYEVIASIEKTPKADSVFACPEAPPAFKPKVGDVIAYQELSFCEETMTPKLSAYLFGRVTSSLSGLVNMVSAQSVDELISKSSSSRKRRRSQLEPTVEVNIDIMANIRLISGPTREKADAEAASIRAFLAQKKAELQTVAKDPLFALLAEKKVEVLRSP